MLDFLSGNTAAKLAKYRLSGRACEQKTRTRHGRRPIAACFAAGLCALFCLTACTGSAPAPAADSAPKAQPVAGTAYDWEDIQQSGELIVATINGPDTYFEQGETPMGRAYAIASAFAGDNGLRLRVEVAADTAQAMQMVAAGEADICAIALDDAKRAGGQLLAAGPRDSLQTAWGVRAAAGELAKAIDDWAAQADIPAILQQDADERQTGRRVQRRVRAPWQSKERGIISEYDSLFHRMASATRMDWRLIAAQCYQESGFDPQAVSRAGAKGLMQIMPATAERMGTRPEDLFNPTTNCTTAARYLVHLTHQFADIPSASERVRFVLAAYNGGPGHIRDAMALTRKYGGNPYRWADVSIYVRRLSQPEYYRDPAVKYGYMIGSETARYVEDIVHRYRAYRYHAR